MSGKERAEVQRLPPAAAVGKSRAHLHPKLFLAFTVDRSGGFQRMIRGVFDHVEIVFCIGTTTHRAIVPRPRADHPDGLVFRDTLQLSQKLDWELLQLPCADAQIALISAAIDVIIARGDYFSENAMFASALPSRLACFLKLWRPEKPRDRGQPTFCSRMCVEALQAAGFFSFLNRDATTASDLYAAAVRCASAFKRDLPSRPAEVNALNIRRSWWYVNGLL